VRNAETVLKAWCDHALWELMESNHPESVPVRPFGMPFDCNRNTVLTRWCPAAWISTQEKRIRTLSMLYSMKRGFAFPCEESVESALEKHEKTLTADAPDTAALEPLARDWATGFAAELAKLGPLPVIADLPSSQTACLEHTIKDGGRARWIEEKIRDSPWRKSFEGKGGVLTDAGKRCVLLHACLEDLRDQGFLRLPMVLDKASFGGAIAPKDRPCTHGTVYRQHCLECGEVFVRAVRTEKERRVRVSPVLEQGFKTRPITVNNGAWATLMHLPRLWLFGMLSRCAEIPSLFEGKKRGVSFLNAGLKRYPDGEVNSLDLSAATDNFSKRLCLALYEGFTALCPPLIREIGRETFRPVTLVYRRKGGVEHEARSVTKGILMGDPCSWAVLNLHNIFLWRLAGLIEDYTGKVLLAKLPELHWDREIKVDTRAAEKDVIRCGDDQLAVAPSPRCRNFEALLVSVGAVISLGAHYASRKWGFYTKCIFRVSDGKFSYYDYFPVRFVTGPMRTKPGERQIPAWWNIGTSCETGVSWFRQGDPARVSEYDHAYWIAGWLFRKPIRKMLSAGVEPFLPRELGGFGLISAKGRFIAITARGKAVWDMLLRDDVTVKAWLLLHLASFVWSLNQDAKCAEMVRGAIAFLRNYYPQCLDGFKGSESEKEFGDPGNPLGIARDPSLPYSLTEAVSAFNAGRFPPYADVSENSEKTPAMWRIALRFKNLAKAVWTPYHAKRHSLKADKVREIIARAMEWRCAKLPPDSAVEKCPGFRKCIPTDEGPTRDLVSRRRFRIDFVPGKDLQRILSAVGVPFPSDEAAARKVREKTRDAREEPDVYFGTRFGSFKAILRAPPEPYCDPIAGYKGIYKWDRGGSPLAGDLP
jgi:hypothetical protein